LLKTRHFSADSKQITRGDTHQADQNEKARQKVSKDGLINKQNTILAFSTQPPLAFSLATIVLIVEEEAAWATVLRAQGSASQYRPAAPACGVCQIADQYHLPGKTLPPPGTGSYQMTEHA